MRGLPLGLRQYEDHEVYGNEDPLIIAGVPRGLMVTELFKELGIIGPRKLIILPNLS